jgi:hypothetical protein
MKSIEVEERIEPTSVAAPSVEKGGTTRGTESEPKGTQRFHPLLELTLARVREFLREPEVIFWVFATQGRRRFASRSKRAKPTLRLHQQLPTRSQTRRTSKPSS